MKSKGMNELEKERRFRELNPQRHGAEHPTYCYVCGELAVRGYVFCPYHNDEYAARRRQNPKRPDMEAIPWAVQHPHFNGVDFNGVFWGGGPCAECNKRTRLHTDYLCPDCRQLLSTSSPV